VWAHAAAIDERGVGSGGGGDAEDGVTAVVVEAERVAEVDSAVRADEAPEETGVSTALAVEVVDGPAGLDFQGPSENEEMDPAFFSSMTRGGARVALYNEPGSIYTQLLVESADRPGLLLNIAETLFEEALDLDRAFVEPRTIGGRGYDRFFVRQRIPARQEWGQVPRDRFEDLQDTLISKIRADVSGPSGFGVADGVVQIWDRKTEQAAAVQKLQGSPVRGVALNAGLGPGQEITAQIAPQTVPGDPTANILVTSPNSTGGGLFLQTVRTLSQVFQLNITRSMVVTDFGRTIMSFTVSGISTDEYSVARDVLLKSLLEWHKDVRRKSENQFARMRYFKQGEEEAGAQVASREKFLQQFLIPAPAPAVSMPTGPLAPILLGLRERINADKAFIFKLKCELVLDEMMTIFTNCIVRGNPLLWAAADFGQVIAHMLQAGFNDFSLVYAMSPRKRLSKAERGGGAGGSDQKEGEEEEEEEQRTQCAHIFQPGDFTVWQRISCWFRLMRLYATIGLINTTLSRVIAISVLGQFELLTPAYLMRAAICGMVHMGLSSNSRYQCVNGLEVLCYRHFSQRIAQCCSIVLRWCNMLVGSRLWLTVASVGGL